MSYVGVHNILKVLRILDFWLINWSIPWGKSAREYKSPEFVHAN